MGPSDRPPRRSRLLRHRASSDMSAITSPRSSCALRARRRRRPMGIGGIPGSGVLCRVSGVEGVWDRGVWDLGHYRMRGLDPLAGFACIVRPTKARCVTTYSGVYLDLPALETGVIRLVTISRVVNRWPQCRQRRRRQKPVGRPPRASYTSECQPRQAGHCTSGAASSRTPGAAARRLTRTAPHSPGPAPARRSRRGRAPSAARDTRHGCSANASAIRTRPRGVTTSPIAWAIRRPPPVYRWARRRPS